LPDYIKNIEQLNAKGYEVIACVTVNDVFVTNAWSESLNATGKVRILADPNAQFTKVCNKIFCLLINKFNNFFK